MCIRRSREHIPEIIDFVSTLVDKGYAYEVNGDVYFSTRKFDGYGKLSRQNIEDLEAGARIAVGDIKKDPLDFALMESAERTLTRSHGTARGARADRAGT